MIADVSVPSSGYFATASLGTKWGNMLPIPPYITSLILYYIIRLNQAHHAKTRRDVLATITWFITTGVGLDEKCKFRQFRRRRRNLSFSPVP